MVGTFHLLCFVGSTPSEEFAPPQQRYQPSKQCAMDFYLARPPDRVRA